MWPVRRRSKLTGFHGAFAAPRSGWMNSRNQPIAVSHGFPVDRPV